VPESSRAASRRESVAMRAVVGGGDRRPHNAAMRAFLTIAVLLPLSPALAQGKTDGKTDYASDVKFAIDAVEQQCKTLIASKKIDWKKVTAPLLAESKKTKTDDAHLLLLWRLVARLQDGHAEVRPLERGKDVKLAMPEKTHGPGMFLCQSGGKVFVKNAWGPAQSVGLEPGMEVLTLDGVPAAQWIVKRTAALADLISFSTSQQATFFTCHQGLADVAGTRLDVEVKDGASKKKRTIDFAKINQTPPGPAFPPEGLQGQKDVFWGTTKQGFGYVHVRRCKEDLPAQMDEALAAIGNVPGLVLDFRGNSGGGFDHEALFGRFLPKDVKWQAGVTYSSAGARPYGGPIVVIVDATVRSAGETGAGMLGEDGRAFTIGESPTAGMSSQKTTIELPSKLFALYVSVASNKGRFQGGKGLEGIGYVPMEIVTFDPADLRARRDTLIVRAEALLAAFPQDKVRYDPKKNGWQAGK
jgi:C-terminal processing protease CtpA/Prc